MTTVPIFVLIDALGWEFLKGKPFLDDLCSTRVGVHSLLGFSSACLPSIYTGLSPVDHGRWGMWRFGDGTTPFRATRWLHWLPELRFKGKNVTRYLLQRYYNRRPEITDYFCLYQIPIKRLHHFDLAGHRDIYQPGGFPGQQSIFDLLARHPGGAYVADWRTPMAEAFATAAGRLRAKEVTAVFLYFADMDAVLHKYGPNDPAPEVMETLGRLERGIEDLVAAVEEAGNRASLHVFSDHGMTEVTATYDILADLARLPLREGRDYRGFYDSTMARFKLFNEAARRAIGGLLANSAHGRIVPDAELERLGVLFADHRYGDLVFITHGGTVLNPSYMSDRAPKGMHGYHPDDPGATGVYLSTDPPPDGLDNIRGLFNVMKGALG
ncbi:hypothetical protein GW813_03115 [bacterium]|nr:hypothetical protein [bacterium]PIX84200.1 MAG: hypothetical protein COZ33_01450 [Nitrospirae bacterium CG_4_10_14_3_um_filter_70_108]